MKKLLPLLIITFLAWLPTSDAQLTISGENVVVCENSGTVSINISVTNFTDIVSAQFAVTWDTDVLSFVNVANNMPSSVLYNTLNAVNGQLHFSWFDVTPPPGYTVPPSGSGVIFTLNFDVVGNYNPDNFSPVSITSIPSCIMEVANTSGIVPNGTIVINNGSVTIADNTAPTVTCPANIITTAAMGQNSATVTFAAPTVTDNCDSPAPAATCSTASGSSFGLGTTQVTCSATDNANNTGSCIFSVTVNPPPPNPNALLISPDDIALNCNATSVDIPFRVENFDLMTSAQFGVVWDETVLDFDGFTDSLNANGHPSAIYNTSNAANGEFFFSWIDANGAAGESLADSSVLFVLHFDLLNPAELPDTVSIDTLTGLGLGIEFTNTGGVISLPNYALDYSIVSFAPDLTPPSITCPANQNLNANANCAAVLPNYTAQATATDNCSAPGDITITQTPVAGSIINATTQVMLIATDEVGLKDTCTFTVNIVDNTPPTITCPANVSVGNDLGNCSALVNLIATATDNCGVSMLTDNAPVTHIYPVGATNVTFTATDSNGNSASCQTTVTVNDTQAPSITCPANILQSNDTGNCSATVTWATPVALDNCPNVTVVSTPPSGTEFPVGDSTVMVIATDAAGNKDTCTFVVTISDDEAPDLVCVADTTVIVPNGTIDTIINNIYLFSLSDNCGVDTLYYSFIGALTGNGDGGNVSGTAFPIGTTTVTYTAEDDEGNLGSCSFDVTIQEDDFVTVVCPTNQTVDNDLGDCDANITGLVAMAMPQGVAVDSFFTVTGATVNDDDGLDASGVYNVGVSTITFYVVNASNDTMNCTTTVTVNDTEDPSITCPANIQQSNDTGNCSATVTWAAPVAVDNCPNVTVVSTPPSGTEFPLGDSTVMVIATDAAGNKDTCTFVVTVSDDEAPVMQCGADTTIIVPVGTIDTIINDIYLFSIGDNCGLDTSYYLLTGALTGDGDGVDVSGTAFPVGTTTVTYFGVDDVGNIGSCSFEVTIQEDDFVTVICPADQTVDNGLNTCNAKITGLVAMAMPQGVAVDSFFTVTGATVNDDDGLNASGFYNVGVSTITFYVVNASNDTMSCTTTVTVNDTIVPVITCPANISQSNDTGSCSAVVTWATPTVVDNCTNLTITCSPPSGTEFPVGIDSTVVCIVTDFSGNADTCSFTVTVTDDEPVTMVCVPDTTILVPVGTVDTIINDIYLFSISDNCGVDTSYFSLTGALTGNGNGVDVSGTAFPVGTTTVTYFGVDDVGNVGSCAFEVTIEEDLPIAISCPSDQAADNDLNTCGASVNGLIATVIPSGAAVDSFFVVTGATVNADDGLNANGLFNVGTSTITFYAVGIGGDTVSCSTVVTVNDVESPIFTNCPTDTVTMNNTIDECGLVFSGAVVPVATDNCPGLSLTYNFTVGNIVPIGFHTVLATATDAAGNATSCNYVLHIIDNQPPKFLNCQNGSTVSVDNDPNQCGAVINWTPIVTAMDNCSLLAFTETSPGNGDFFPVGNTTVTYTAVDDKGNVATCEIHVTVADTQAPAIVCPGNQPPVNTDLNQCSATVNFPQPTASDNCAVVSFVATTPVGPVFNEGVSTVTYEATDAAGNLTTCSFTVTVVDNQFPFIPNMPADITAYTNANSCGAIVPWTPPSLPIDNCGIDTFGPSGGAPGDFFGVGTHDVNYVAMDVNGNITVETLTITVLDTLPPVVNCPTGISVTVDGNSIDDPDNFLVGAQQVDCDNIELDFGTISASDPCGVATLTQTGGLPSGSAFPIGANNLTFVATDNYGNTTNCSFTVNVVDYQIAPATVSQGTVCEGGSVTFSVGSLPGATYTWTFGGNVVSNNQTFTIADAALNQSGIYTVVVSTAACDIQFTTEVNVTAVPVVTIDANDILCASNNMPLTLTGVNSSTANVTNWTWDFPNGSSPTGQTQTLQNPTVNNSGEYCVTATTQFGCAATACQQVNVFDGPQTPVITATAPNYCVGANGGVTLFGQLYNGSNVVYHWYADPALGSGIQNINNPVQTVYPTVADTFTYHFYVTVDGCTSDTAEWAVVVQAAPVIDLAVTGQTQCVDGTSDVTLTDNGTGAVSWMWSGGPFGTLPGNSSSVVLHNVIPLYSGTYNVTATSSIGCSSTAFVPITFTAAPSQPAMLTASPSTICEGADVTLTGTQYLGNVSYVWIGDNIPPNSQNNNVITVFPTGTGDYSFAAIVNGCYTDTMTVTVTVEPIPALDIVVSGNTNCVDGTTSVTLSTAASGLTNLEWTDINGTVLSNASTLVLANVTAADAGPIYVSATNQQGCTGYGSTFLDITDGISGLTASYTMIDCELGVVSLDASSIAGANYAWFRPNNNQPFALTQSATASNAGDGDYLVVAQLNGCTDTASVFVNVADVLDANNKEVNVVVDSLQEFNILAGDVYDLDQPFTITILQEPTNGSVSYANKDSIYQYTPTAGFWGTDFIIYEICYTDCPTLCSTAKVTFNVNFSPGECVITTAISPNDDGYNDEMVISCLIDETKYPLNKLVIYNQWGDQVYEAAPYKNNWKGTNDGKKLPDGTYFYIFQRDPSEPAQKGFVMIYR